MKLSTMTPLIGLTATALFTGIAAAQESPEVEIRRIEIADGEKMSPEERMKRFQQQLRDTPAAREWPGREHGGADSAWRIGVLTDELNPIVRTHLGIPKDTGLLVKEVMENSPAAKAGLKANDIIVSVGDRPVTNFESLKSMVQRTGAAGRPLVLAIIHEGKRSQIRIEPPKPEPVRPQANDRGPDKIAPNPERIANALKQRDRQIEEMRGQIKRLSHALEKQQEQIKALEMKFRETSSVKERADSPLARRAVIRFVPVEHMDVEKAASQVRAAMDGSVEIAPDVRTRRVLISGDEEKLRKAERLLKSIDVEVPAAKPQP
jgi:membrane-associated protease RseP (regulator of RpoE activity)